MSSTSEDREKEFEFNFLFFLFAYAVSSVFGMLSLDLGQDHRDICANMIGEALNASSMNVFIKEMNLVTQHASGIMLDGDDLSWLSNLNEVLGEAENIKIQEDDKLDLLFLNRAKDILTIQCSHGDTLVNVPSRLGVYQYDKFLKIGIVFIIGLWAFLYFRLFYIERDRKTV